MIKNIFFIGISLALGVSACKKQDNNEDPGDPACQNYNLTYIDSVMTLVYTVEQLNRSSIGTTFQGTSSFLITDLNYEYWGPSLSPDGTKLLCFRSPLNQNSEENDKNTAELWLFNSDGTNGQVLITDNEHGWVARGSACWAPDGTHIVLSVQKPDPTDNANLHWHLFAVDISGNNPVQLSTRASFFDHPEINSAGTQITYNAWPVGTVQGNEFNSEIFTADLNTTTWTMTNEQRMTSDGEYDYAPHYSPDGTDIVFTTQNSVDPKLNVDVRVIFNNGASLSTLVSNGEANMYPVWDNTGTYVYFSYLYNTICFWSLARVKSDGTEFAEVIKIVNGDITQTDNK